MKKIFSTMILLFLIAVFSISVVADDDITPLNNGYYQYGNITFMIKEGTAIITGFKRDAPEENVCIPSTLAGYPVTEIYRGAFSNNNVIKSVIIPDTVSVIGEQAFSACSNLVSVEIPNSVTSIEQCAFDRCKNLKSIVIPASLTIIRSSTFWDCSSLSEIVIPDGVKKIEGGAFYGCAGLTTITIPESVESIGLGTFGGCTSLTSIVIPENVKSIGVVAFAECENLENVIFLNPETYFEEKITHKAFTGDPYLPTFGECNSLSHIYAFKNTQAQSFAQKNNMTFTPLARVTVNGERLKFDMPPIIEGGRVLVPLRKIFEALNAEVNWDDASKTVTAVSGNKNISLKIGADSMTVNGEKISLDVPAKIKNGRTLVPLRAVSSALGANVGWDEESQTAVITN